MKTLQQTQFGAGPSQSLQLALEFSGQVRAEYSKTCSNASICTHMTIDQAADDSSRIGQQADQIATFEPDVEEVSKYFVWKM